VPADDPRWRRALARELTRLAKASATEAIQEAIGFGGMARRVGITGPPGAGKSSLIARLARNLTAAGERVGVLAIDPTSPVSGGSLLGDRIRMEEAAENLNLYIRSLASGVSADGLCPNIAALLHAFDEAGFDRLILETVGVGQVSYTAKTQVDSLVLVLVPESGDTIQAMKAGIMEMADIYVVNKADLPGAERLAAELRTMADWRSQQRAWKAQVILTSATTNRGITELAQAIDAHREATLDEARQAELALARREYHLRSTLLRRADAIIALNAADCRDGSLAAAYNFILGNLADAPLP
jgi:LAO/AO transport system kinase